MKLDALKKNAALIEDGTRVQIDATSSIVVRSARSPKARDVLAEINKRHRSVTARRGETLSASEQDEMDIEWAARGMLVGWDGMEMDGQPLPFTPENALFACGFVEFRDIVINAAHDMANFQAEGLAAVGNGASPRSKRGSGTSTPVGS